MYALARECAKVMRGSVPEWDETYVEKYLPNDIFNKMKTTESWVDDKGYTWGFTMVSATRLSKKVGPCESGTPIAIMASKYMGMGYSEMVAIDALGNIIEITCSDIQ